MKVIVAQPPRFAGMLEFDCAVCGAETLKHPVFLTDGTGPAFPAGTGCAANLLYGKSTGATRAAITKAATAAETAERRVQALIAANAARIEDEAFCAWILAEYGWTITQPADLWDRIPDRAPHSYRLEYRALLAAR